MPRHKYQLKQNKEATNRNITLTNINQTKEAMKNKFAKLSHSQQGKPAKSSASLVSADTHIPKLKAL